MTDTPRRVALVTGAAKNIGAAIALRLAQDDCDIALHVGRDPAAGAGVASDIASMGRAVEIFTADLSSPEASEQLVADVVSRFGRLDILVNNAAIRPESAFESLSFQEWRAVMAIALDAPFLMSQAALPHLTAASSGRIVNIGGLTAHTGASMRTHVVAAKAGLVGLTKALATEIGDRGITVNCVSPGLIETKRAEGAAPAHHARRRGLLARLGTVEDVAEAVAYLCSPTADYVTGQTLHVNGGAYLP